MATTVAGKIEIDFIDVLKGIGLSEILDFSSENIHSVNVEFVSTSGKRHKLTSSEPKSIIIERIESDDDEENKKIAKLQLDDLVVL